MRSNLCRNTVAIALAAVVTVREINGINAFIGYRQPQMQRGVCLSSTDNDNSSRRAAGPKAQGRRRSTRSPSNSSGPRSPRAPRRTTRPEAADRPIQQEPKSKESFDGKVFCGRQDANAEAPLLDLRQSLSSHSGFRCVTQGLTCFETGEEKDIQRLESPFEYRSLDDLLELPAGFSLSEMFNSDAAFRKDLRSAIRLDVFETTPFYANLPEKAKTVLLLPDSSLEGSWRIPETTTETESEDNDDKVRRMKYTTRVLNQAIEKHFEGASEVFRFTGDDLFEAIGSICGDGASTHWIDIYGVQDRQINHSWHLDAGRSPKNCKTVLWGFPPEDHYKGTGVFSHIVSLEDPFGSTLDIVDEAEERSRMEPVLFEGTLGEEYVFRPLYEPGKELLIYRDIDVLHSAPDIAYRTSVMRFM